MQPYVLTYTCCTNNTGTNMDMYTHAIYKHMCCGLPTYTHAITRDKLFLSSARPLNANHAPLQGTVGPHQQWQSPTELLPVHDS